MLGVSMSPLGSLFGCLWLCLPTLLQFLDQENQMCRTQLLEVEARLNSTLATLQERVLQHEELMESHQRLRYRPTHQLHSNPSVFGKSSPLLGVRGHCDHGHCCPSQVWWSGWVGEAVRKPSRSHLEGS